MQTGAPILVRSGFVTNAGKFVRASPDAVTVQTQGGELTMQKADVDEIYVFRSRAERVHRALLVGGIAAGATAAAIFPFAASVARRNYVLPSVAAGSSGVTLGFAGSRSRVKRIYRRD